MNNQERCEWYAEMLEDAAFGRLYKCPECGEWVTYVEVTNKDADGDDVTLYRMSDGHTSDDKPEEITIYDWISEMVFDWEFVIGRDMRYKYAVLTIAYGGPTVEVDTFHSTVTLHFGIESVVCGYNPRIALILNDHFEELWYFKQNEALF